MADAARTPRSSIHRHPERGRYDRATIDAILDEALVCHLGFVSDGQPMVIPTMYVRDGDRVVVHGSAASRMTRTVGTGVPVCLTVTLLDGVVFARTANNHSMNYRSAVLLGTAEPITEPVAKLEAMRALVERIAPGRWDRIREPDDKEMRSTTILSLPIDEASAKVRTGPPLDDGEDWDCRSGPASFRCTSLRRRRSTTPRLRRASTRPMTSPGSSGASRRADP